MSINIPISDLDVVYLSYDEPQKEKFWLDIQTKLPWAIRVDGVKGSDAAHKAAAEASTTDRFILIDGDNVPDYEFFNQSLTLTDNTENAVFRWRARNHINGLMYGNGGLSCWTKQFIRNMKTHEATDGRAETVVEFCFDPGYLALHNSYSVTYPNGSPLHAWRAGFREGVKMCLDRGRLVDVPAFIEMANWKNIEYLNIWHSIGTDVEYGYWATYGARMGTYMTMIDPDWDYTHVQSFERLGEIFQSVNVLTPQQRRDHYIKISRDIRETLKLPCIEMGPEQSAFWKRYYTKLHRNKGIMEA